MDNYFFDTFCKKLIEEEFFLINNLVKNLNLINDNSFNLFFKKISNMGYIVLAIKIDNKNFNTQKYFIEQTKSLIKKINKELTVNKIVFLQILIGKDFDFNILNFANTSFEEDDKLMQAKWIVNNKTQNIIIKGNQPTKILNIYEIIKGSFYKNNALNKTNQELSFNPPKNKNITLTLSLIIINLIIYAIMKLGGADRENLFLYLGAITPTMLRDNEAYRILTSAFLHSSLQHILSNCLSLYIFGSIVEKNIGKLVFFNVYFLGAIGSSLFSYFFTRSLSVGASGAIFALEGSILYAAISQKKKFLTLDFQNLLMLIICGLAFGFLNPRIDNAAHIGGFIVGILVTFVLEKLQNLKN